MPYSIVQRLLLVLYMYSPQPAIHTVKIELFIILIIVSPDCRHAQLRTTGAGGGACDSRQAAAQAAARVAYARTALCRRRAHFIPLSVPALPKGPPLRNQELVGQGAIHVQVVRWQQQHRLLL
jgi:hypothetical protein